jgi:hypothetical protein
MLTSIVYITTLSNLVIVNLISTQYNTNVKPIFSDTKYQVHSMPHFKNVPHLELLPYMKYLVVIGYFYNHKTIGWFNKLGENKIKKNKLKIGLVNWVIFNIVNTIKMLF